MVFFRVAVLGGSRDGWAARVGQAENFGGLVETFADGVVARGADDFEVVVTLHVDDLGVTAGNDGGEKWEFGLVAAEPVGVDMGFEVVSRVEWDVVYDGDGAGS